MRSAQRRPLIATAGAAVCAGLAAAASCALPSYGVDDSLAPDGGTPTGVGGSAGASPTGGGGTSQGGSLPNVGGMLSACGPSGSYDQMVAVPGGYCIDGREVSAEDYQNWVGMIMSMDVPSELEAIEGCATNWDQYPAGLFPVTSCQSEMVYETTTGSYPIACIDWCDAAAFCRAHGKHLCGKRGGGSNAYDAYTDPTRSEWFNACTSGGRHGYPYGDEFAMDKCNTQTAGPGRATQVGSKPSCVSSESGYAGVRDLSGNVAEWEDSCNGQGADALCRVRGGHWQSADADALCADETSQARDTYSKLIGFRCCWAPDDAPALTDGGVG